MRVPWANAVRGSRQGSVDSGARYIWRGRYERLTLFREKGTRLAGRLDLTLSSAAAHICRGQLERAPTSRGGSRAGPGLGVTGQCMR